jgi:Tfp pilus assembly protein PilE
MEKCFVIMSIKKRFKNNKGSTLAMAMVAIAFVAILATVVISMAMGNLTLKTAAAKSKKTFYTAESALDEIYTGLGMSGMNSMSDAYKTVLSNLVRKDATNSYNYMIDNDTANNELKDYFIDNMLQNIGNNDPLLKTGTDGSYLYTVPDKDKILDTENVGKSIITKLNSYIKNADTAKVLSFTDITVYKKRDTSKSYYIYIKDMVLTYKSEKGYFSDVTVDVEVEYPNVSIDFTGVNNLRVFRDYAIIADGNISFGDNTAITASINSNIIAGKNIEVLKGSQVTFDSADTKNINIIAGEDLLVKGDTTNTVKSLAKVMSADIWAKNISLSKNTSGGIDTTLGAKITSETDSNLYIKDDLELNGKYSEVNLKGDYYGYSYDGYSADESLPSTSSAIIVNGQYSGINISSSKLVLGGHAYIKFNEDPVIVSPYMMGEALSVIGNQQMYNVPDEYVKDDGTVAVDSSFFAYSLLNPTENYVKKTVLGVNYYYLNFSSKANITKYVKAVLNDDYYAQTFPGQTTAQRNQRTSIKNTANTKIHNILRGENIDISSATDAFSMGSMITASDSGARIYVNNEAYSETDVSYANGTGLLSTNGFVLTSLNLKNRYELLLKILVDLPDTVDEKPYIVNDMYEAVKKEYAYALRDQDLYNTAAKNVVDFSLIESTEGFNDGNNPEKILFGGEEIYAIAKDGSYEVPALVNKGIILATGNVTLSHDFTGTIITTGNILIKNNAKIINSTEYTDYLMDKEITENFNQYFYAYKSSGGNGESIKVSSLKYSDILSFNNWRKYNENEE